MEKTSNVQLHKIIKNSLASYLSYKWSKNKLYLKRRKNKSRKEKKIKEKKPTNLEKKHSIINLENDIFIYDAKTKTFTQLDLCDCFRNGLKYRKLDPFNNTQASKKKHELPQITKNSSDISRDFQNFQLDNIEDSVEQIFSNQLLKKDHWEKAINAICPSKFDLFLQKEFNECNGKNFNLKSFKINPDFEAQSKNNVRSSAAIGYYKITTYDNALQCDTIQNSQTKIGKNKRCNFVGIQKETFDPKKMCNKGLQCKQSNHIHRASNKEEKVLSTNETGVQCCIKSPHNTAGKRKVEPLDANVIEILTHHKKSPTPRQKSHKRKKPLRRRPSSLSDLHPPAECENVGNVVHINSSAEIRNILNEKRSSPSFTLSNTGEYFRTFLNSQHPRTLLTYYQTSSSSRDNGGDAYDEQFFKKQHIVVATTSNPISPICSGPCRTKTRQRPPPCICSCGTNYDGRGGRRRNQNNYMDDGRTDQDRRRSTKTAGIQNGQSFGPNDMESERRKSTRRVESQTDNVARNDMRTQSDNEYGEPERTTDGRRRTLPGGEPEYTTDGRRRTQAEGEPENATDGRRRTQADTRNGEFDQGQTSENNPNARAGGEPENSTDGRRRTQTAGEPENSTDGRRRTQTGGGPENTTDGRRRTQSDIKNGEFEKGQASENLPGTQTACVIDCPDPCSSKNAGSICSCCHQPILKKKPCCDCPDEMKRPNTVKTKCICDILTCLKERIKLQTEEQNRNLDQILEELNKQDQELKEIRNFVEKYNESKNKSKKPGRVRECSCYAVTVQQDFTTDMTPLPDSIKKEKTHETESVHVQEIKSSEPEIIELFGSNDTFDRKPQKKVFKKDSWKALWNKNSEVKTFFATDFLKKRSVKKKLTTSSNTTTEEYESKKIKKDHKHWFSHLFTSKKDLRKKGS